jgi:hypothetical protein
MWEDKDINSFTHGQLQPKKKQFNRPVNYNKARQKLRVNVSQFQQVTPAETENSKALQD